MNAREVLFVLFYSLKTFGPGIPKTLVIMLNTVFFGGFLANTCALGNCYEKLTLWIGITKNVF